MDECVWVSARGSRMLLSCRRAQVAGQFPPQCVTKRKRAPGHYECVETREKEKEHGND